MEAYTLITARKKNYITLQNPNKMLKENRTSDEHVKLCLCMSVTYECLQ